MSKSALAQELPEETIEPNAQKQPKPKIQLPDGLDGRTMDKEILRLAWPSVAELVLTSLSGMVDMIMVGQLGPWALSAVGLNTQPRFLLLAIFVAMNTGATALIARSKGAGDRELANKTMRQAMMLTVGMSVVIAALGLAFAEPIIWFMGAQADTIGPGTDYFRVQCYGLLAATLSLAITAALRGAGNTRASMRYNLTANVLNVILNYCLIYGNFGCPRMEVAGASLATILGSAAASGMALFTLLRGKQYVRLRWGDSFMPDWGNIKRIVKIGLPAMFEQLVMRVGMITFTKQVSSLGTIGFATHNICQNILQLTLMNGQAFGIAATTLVGQSLGRREPDVGQAYALRTSRWGMIISAAIALSFFFFGEFLVGLYTDDPQILQTGANVMKIIAIIQPFQSSQLVLTGALRGAGDTKSTARIIFVTMVCIRPLMAVVFMNLCGWGLYGAWSAVFCDQLLRQYLVRRHFKKGSWKLIKV